MSPVLSPVASHRGAENRPFIYPSNCPSCCPLSPLRTETKGCCCCVYRLHLWGFPVMEYRPHSAALRCLFAPIKFNRPVWGPPDPERAGQQQSNVDFHYLKLQWPNYIQSNQNWVLQSGFHYSNAGILFKHVKRKELLIYEMTSRSVNKWVSRVLKSCWLGKLWRWQWQQQRFSPLLWWQHM